MKNKAIAKAERNAAVFLLSPRATEEERAEELRDSAELLRAVTEKLVRAGRDDLAFAAQQVALKAEHE